MNIGLAISLVVTAASLLARAWLILGRGFFWRPYQEFRVQQFRVQQLGMQKVRGDDEQSGESPS